MKNIMTTLLIVGLIAFVGCNQPNSNGDETRTEKTRGNAQNILSKGGYEAVEAIRAYQKSPKDVFISYWTAIYLDEYGSAYQLLSSQSRKAFDDLGGESYFGQMYQQIRQRLDLGQSMEEIVSPNEALVGVQLLEDPAASIFRLVKEGNEWKMVITPH
ncbi:MAG: hypothetical protein ACE5OR_16580 [bacterium]